MIGRPALYTMLNLGDDCSKSRSCIAAQELGGGRLLAGAVVAVARAAGRPGRQPVEGVQSDLGVRVRGRGGGGGGTAAVPHAQPDLQSRQFSQFGRHEHRPPDPRGVRGAEAEGGELADREAHRGQGAKFESGALAGAQSQPQLLSLLSAAGRVCRRESRFGCVLRGFVINDEFVVK